MYSLARPLLFCLDAERAHALGLAGLEAAYRSGLNPLLAVKPKPLQTKAFGIEFPNPVGCAAGLDKNGEHIDALLTRVLEASDSPATTLELVRAAGAELGPWPADALDYAVFPVAGNLERLKWRGLVGSHTDAGGRRRWRWSA